MCFILIQTWPQVNYYKHHVCWQTKILKHKKSYVYDFKPYVNFNLSKFIISSESVSKFISIDPIQFKVLAKFRPSSKFSTN